MPVAALAVFAQCSGAFRQVSFPDTHVDLCDMILEEELQCTEGDERCEPFVCLANIADGCTVEFVVFADIDEVRNMGREFCPQIEYSRREVDGTPFYYETVARMCVPGQPAPEGIVPLCVGLDSGGSSCR